MKHWLVKSEPFKYSFGDLQRDGETFWDGVRNYAARIHLNSMKVGDKVMFYHSNEGIAVMGIAKVTKAAFPDPTSDDPQWVAVNIAPVKAFKRPVTLAEIKAHPALQNIALVRIGRLSVMPLMKEEFEIIEALGK
ncbi:MAG: EVE domain-containing protein [Bacteroidetes bacterium]|nr:EVE domain-containing protein [Bacteroidota bacterium]